jgi:hypothetical protein
LPEAREQRAHEGCADRLERDLQARARGSVVSEHQYLRSIRSSTGRPTLFSAPVRAVTCEARGLMSVEM